MSRFQSRELVGVSRFILPLFAAAILLWSAPTQGKEPAPAGKTAAGPTRKVPGCVLDADGRPIADATVCLTRENDADDDVIEPIILAQTKSRGNGCFELTPLESEFKKVPAGESPPVYELWIHKPGLAPAHAALFDDPSAQPILISLQNESHVTIRVRNPNGSPRRGATVTPTALLLANERWVTFPKPIKDQLTVQSAADGHAAVAGFDGQSEMLTVRAPDLGAQSLVISGKRSCPWTATLHPTRLLTGQFMLPKGENADLSRGKAYVAAYHKERSRARCARGRAGAYWWVAQMPSVSRDGQFTAPNLPNHGGGYLKLWLSEDMPFVPEYGLGSPFALRSENSGRGPELVICVRFPAHVFSPVMNETTFRFETALPTQLALLKAVWGAATQPNLRLDVPLRRGVVVTRVFRDAVSGRPLAGIEVAIWHSDSRRRSKQASNIKPWVAQLTRLPVDGLYVSGAIAEAANALLALIPQQGDFQGVWETDKNGRVSVCLYPGKRYEMCWEISEGHRRRWSADPADVQVPRGVDRLTLEPINVAPPRTIQGRLADGTGQALEGLRVLASYVEPAGDAKTSPAKDVSRWTKTDRLGNFHFEGVTAGTKVTLVPIRDGFPVAAPVQAVAGENKTSQIKEEKGDLVALTGRVVGPDHKPIAGAQVVIQVEHSPDPQHIFRATLDADGTFQTPAQFPKQLKYRLTARSILKDVASTDWLCPAAGRSSTTLVHFPDLVADRSQLGLEKRIPGEQVAALVDGRPILAKELLERAYPEPLSPEGLSLLTAAKAIKSGRVTESEYRALQETAIKKYAGDYARTRMLARALEATLDEGQKVQIERAIDKMFDEYVEKLKQDLHTSSRAGVDSKLREQGTSLAGLKIEFRHRLLADEYSRQAGGHVSEIAWQRLFEYYQAHRQAYAVPEKVSWQLLEVEFDNPADRLPKAGEQAVKKETDPSARAVAADYSQPAADQLHLGSSILDGASDRLATQRTATDFTPDNSAIASKEKHDEFDAVKYFAELNSRVSREKARHTMDEALAQLHKGVSFADVAKKFSTGPHADQGGWQARVRPNSLADEKTAVALRQLPEGAPSGVIETDHSFRIIRVASRTPAGRKPFEEVEESIREHFRDDLQAKALEELYSRTSIESPYIDDVSSISHPVAACRSPKAQQDAFAQ